MAIKRDGDDCILSVGNVRIRCEGLLALLVTLGLPALTVILLLAAIF